MPKQESDALVVFCPGCRSRLTIDRRTGAILLEERPRQEGFRNLDEAAREAEQKRQQAHAQLEKAMDEARHRDEIMEKKFREAVKKAEETDEKPPRPFDFD
ncbi:MAG: hypothetical protein HY509_00050 [Acidobacteria bacterium]|nr:hypothetical protein [Acidobacteriota bacterium]